ncbi:hypothetical protein UlMin_015924 [Ulmus minor]
MNKTETHIQNQGVALRNLENQVGQLANALSSRPSGALPSNTESPQRDGKEHAKAITLRSGNTVEVPEARKKAQKESDLVQEEVITEKEKNQQEKNQLIEVEISAEKSDTNPPVRRLNPIMKEVVKNEIIKWLDAGIIYPISDSSWVSPVQCVPKKGGMTVVENEKNELIPTRVVTGWRICMDYRRLNKNTWKDHFPLPFIDQMLDRLAGREYYCFLDGYSGYNQIVIAPEDQHKTTFTCPYGTFAFRRMPFGLCNVPATFQRCMTAIFTEMVEHFVKVFMDDFSVFGDSFGLCLENLAKVLKRCEETNLVLNWEKCHFMVKEGIVLGHKVSRDGLEVDKAKVETIEKLPPPVSVKGIRSFLGYAGFYRRFIKDFSKVAKPLCNLLEKDRKLDFD